MADSPARNFAGEASRIRILDGSNLKDAAENGYFRTTRSRIPSPTPTAALSRGQRRYKGRICGVHRNGRKLRITPSTVIDAAIRTCDYEQKYPEDLYGEEAFPEARVWRVYSDEAEVHDLERIEAWRDALDVLLVFIGLFSAIVTTFVVQTSQTLQPDYSQVTAIVIWDIFHAITNSSSSSPSFTNVPDPRELAATPTRGDALVNTLWFASLAISLSTGLFTTLVKQWLYHYATSISASTSRERARNRQFRVDGLRRYRVALIIDLLPVALHSALAIFMAGLAIFLLPLHTTMFRIVAGISGASYVLYFVSALLPILDPQCPYHSPITSYLYLLIRYPLVVTIRRISWSYGTLSHKVGKFSHGKRPPSPYTPPPPSLEAEEKLAVVKSSHQLDVNSIVWLHETSGNSTARNIALEAFGGLAPSKVNAREAYRVLDMHLTTAIKQCSTGTGQIPMPEKEDQHDRIVRAACLGGRFKVDKGLRLDLMVIDEKTPHPADVFSRWVLPWCGLDQQGHRFTAVFALCSSSSFPLPIWAVILRLAKQYRPDNPVIKVTLFPTLLQSMDDSEVGSVRLKSAAQNPFIRSLILDYLSISEPKQEDVCSSFMASLSTLLDEEEEYELSRVALDFASLSLSPSTALSLFRSSYSPLSHLFAFLFPTTFQSLSTCTRGILMDEEQRLQMSTVLNRFFASAYATDASWETLGHAVESWGRCEASFGSFSPRRLRSTITTSTIILPIFARFHRRGQLQDNELHDIRQTVSNLEDIVSISMRTEFTELAETVCDYIRSTDMLSQVVASGEEETCLRLFWSPGMCQRILERTYQLGESQAGQRWFDDWMSYIHEHHRLVFLCKWIIPFHQGWRANSLYDLCRIQPHNPVWPSCFQALLTLLEELDYIERVKRDWGNQLGNPRKHLAVRLARMKWILEDYHDLSDPAFDIPRVDEEETGSVSQRDMIVTEDFDWGGASLGRQTCSDSPTDTVIPHTAVPACVQGMTLGDMTEARHVSVDMVSLSSTPNF